MVYRSSTNNSNSDVDRKLEKEKLLFFLHDKILPDFNDFIKLIEKNSNNFNDQDFKIKCKELLNLTKVLLNLDVNYQLLEIGSMYILTSYYETNFIEQIDNINFKLIDKLKDVFDEDSICDKVLKKTINLCNFFFQITDQEELHYFFQNNFLKRSENQNQSESSDEDEKLNDVLNFNYQNKPDKVKKIEKGITWLKEKLREIIKNKDSFFTYEDLINIILDKFHDSNYSAQVFQNDLLNLIGFDYIEFISELIENKESILQSIFNENEEPRSSSSNSFANNENTKKIKNYNKPKIFFKEPKKPSFTQTITIQTEEELKMQKLINKFEKKAYQERKRLKAKFGNNSDNNFNDNFLIKDNLSNELGFYLTRIKNDCEEKKILPFVFDIYADIKKTASYLSNQKILLPDETETKDMKSYKEIMVPALEKPKLEILEKYKLIPIKDLDPIGQKVFEGFKTLNQIQSIVFETASKTNKNMLICAPTGAGKTNVALLTILNEIRKNVCPITNKIKKDDFKIIYVAPMKALASEMTDNFSKKLKNCGLEVRELSGDIQLTWQEIKKTQVIVTTPEKFDVITRKTKENSQLMDLIKLVIIDEIHLLQTDRGPVLESLVARIFRYVESNQKMIRLVGLSATLPNYIDVAEFLQVNLKEGLFYFDSRFRPVPMSQTFIGCKSVNKAQVQKDMNEICFEKVCKIVQGGNQCMVFVHTRGGTLKTASYLKDETVKSDLINLFAPRIDIYQKKTIEGVRNIQLRDLMLDGFAIHHAGLLRQDRNKVEQLFKDGLIRVLVSTATLAWGVNLPAHAVIIKGTEMYDPKTGGFVDLDILDVIQIFGRAGRPQFDTLGHGMIITTHDKLRNYLSILTNQFPIESQFLNHLTDNLNAEIVSGTVTTIDEAVEWMSYTYLFNRMQKNSRNYGIEASTFQNDPDLYHKRIQFIKASVEKLDQAKMIRYDPFSGTLDSTDLGRVASHFYIKFETIIKFNEFILDTMLEEELLSMFCLASEFNQLKAREEEMEELIEVKRSNCMLKTNLTPDNSEGKVNILLQAFLSRVKLNSFSLTSDTYFIQQNIKRISRGLFDYSIKKGLPLLSRKLLTFSKMFELEQWDFETPFRQLGKQIDKMEIEKLEKLKLPLYKIRSKEYSHKDLSRLLRCSDEKALKIKKLANCLPLLNIEVQFRPITRSVLQVILNITPDFEWNDNIHGKICETFWIWMEDDVSNHIYHYENFKLTRKQVMKKELQNLSFTIPLLNSNEIPTHYIIHYDSDKWISCSQDVVISCENLKLPEKFLPFTALLDLHPLPLSALKNETFQSLYKFTHFNPIQTQIFHTLYHTDHNVLLGAPTGSGKTICAEICVFRLFNNVPKGKIVYIGPLKALVRERVVDWKKKMEGILGKKVVELTGDTTPDIKAILNSDIIVTTPEKWDGVSRSWNTRKYVKDVFLIIIDEIHLLNENRGPVLEAIVSRTNFINRHTGKKIRIVGLSTAIANAQDLAHWLNIEKIGLYNFKPSVRPVPLEVHLSGYSGKHYCPRMATMNKPVYRAIQQHSHHKPVIVFVSSRRQTRLTALDLISFCTKDNPKQWIKASEQEINSIIDLMIKDTNLKLTLAFGIGLHHAGLHEQDRSLVEELFANNKIQILISTSTLAWGVNLPAHLVVIKGTEYYDGKTHKYVDFPITDVLQMMGRAGRPQYDTFGKAVILVHDVKKEYYKKFLYEPFPVESSLVEVLPSHLNAEIVAGTIKTKDDCVQYLSWTFLFRRMLKNPSYYNLANADLDTVSKYLTELINKSLDELIDCYCVQINEDDRNIESLPLGQITSFYYLQHRTVKIFADSINSNNHSFEDLLWLMSKALEFSELPVRHNEEILNKELNNFLRFKVKDDSFDSSHTKTYILLQAHFSRLTLPCSDYLTDLKSIIDNYGRVLQAMIDISAMKGFSITCLRLVIIMQMVLQARWFDDETVLILPFIDKEDLPIFVDNNLPLFLPQLISVLEMQRDLLEYPLKNKTTKKETEINTIYQAIGNYPIINLNFSLFEKNSNFKIEKLDLNHPDSEKENYISLKNNSDYVLEINLRKLKTRISNIEQKSKAICPKYFKAKDENWFFILENQDSKELLALRRCSPFNQSNNLTEKLSFNLTNQNQSYNLTLYFLSDCYLGFDQQYNIYIKTDL